MLLAAPWWRCQNIPSPTFTCSTPQNTNSYSTACVEVDLKSKLLNLQISPETPSLNHGSCYQVTIYVELVYFKNKIITAGGYPTKLQFFHLKNQFQIANLQITLKLRNSSLLWPGQGLNSGCYCRHHCINAANFIHMGRASGYFSHFHLLYIQIWCIWKDDNSDNIMERTGFYIHKFISHIRDLARTVLQIQ